MGTAVRHLLLVTCVVASATNMSALALATASPVVVLLKMRTQELHYPPLAQAARVTGTVTVRVLVRPDESEAEVTVFPQTESVVEAVARSGGRCRVARNL